MEIFNASCPVTTLKGLSDAEIKALVISVLVLPLLTLLVEQECDGLRHHPKYSNSNTNKVH